MAQIDSAGEGNAMPHPNRAYKADVIYFLNNGVLAIAPTLNGRLSSLVRRTTATNRPQVWIFRNIGKSRSPRGDEFVDTLARGVTMGSLEAGESFLKLCRDLGLDCVSERNLWVPCSNGMTGGVTDGGRRLLVTNWDPEELALLRFDALPDREALTQLRDGRPTMVARGLTQLTSG